MKPPEDVNREELGRDDLSREVREIRRLFQEAHRDEAVPPPFEALWNLVRAEATTWPGPPRPRFVLTGALAVFALALVIVWALREPASNPAPPTPGPLVAEADWDRTWAGWEGPLDFLLDSPGRAYLESVPTLMDEPTLDEGTSTAEPLPEWERRRPDAL